MPANDLAVNSAPMARREPASAETEQVNFRWRVSTVERLEAFKRRYPLKITSTAIAEAAVLEWLARNEPSLPPEPGQGAKPKPR